MDWGNSFLQWLASDEGWRVLSGAVIPAVAIVVAGALAALIGRGMARRLIALHQRDALAAALGGFMQAGRKAAEWNTLSDLERAQLDQLVAEAEIRIRLLPIAGAPLAASWAAHELAAMKRDSAGFQFQAQQTLADYRDRLVAWSERPRRAKALFGADLDRWRFEPSDRAGVDGLGVVRGAEGDPAAETSAPADSWIPQTTAGQPSPLTPEPPRSVATATGSMPLIITAPLPARAVRDRVLPASAG